MWRLALAFLVACGSDKAAPPPPAASSPTPAPVAADAAVDAQFTPEDKQRVLQRLREQDRGSPPFVPVPAHAIKQECLANPLAKGC